MYSTLRLSVMGLNPVTSLLTRGAGFQSSMDVVAANLDRIKTPGTNDRVYKDECFYSFDSPVRYTTSFSIALVACTGLIALVACHSC